MRKKRRVPIRNVDVEIVVQKLGIEYTKRDDFELYARCPNPDHADKKPSWHIHAELGAHNNGLFHCWSCKWSGNVFALIMTVKRISFVRALQFAEQCRKEISYETTCEVAAEEYERSLNGVEPGEVGLIWKGKKIQAVSIEINKDAWRYLRSRWIGSEYIERFGFLDWKEGRRVIVPIFRDGRLISWIARSYVGSKPKTLAPQNAPKKWEIFGYDNVNVATKAVTVAEGWVDVIRLMQIGRPNPIALCGSKITEYQAEFLSQFKSIEVWMDGDKAGEVLAKDAAAWLGRDRQIRVVPLPQGMDPGEYPPWELKEFEPIDWLVYLQKRRNNNACEGS